jgi:hypothetical protein
MKQLSRGDGQLRLYPIQAARATRLFPYFRTTRLWMTRHNRSGIYRHFVRQRNIRAAILHGRQSFHFAFYCILYPKATAAETNAYLYQACGGACNSLIHPRYPEQKTDSVFLGNVDQPQLGKLWTRETYRLVGTIGTSLILLVSEMSEAMTLLIWIRRASLCSLRTEAREKPTSISDFAN